jgi:CrcB protein
MMLESLVFTRTDRSVMVPLYLGVSLVGGMVLVWAGARVAEAWR